MDGRWFSRPGSSQNAQHSTHELPRWRAPSHMVASMIPPPIVPQPSSSRSLSPVLQSKIVLTEQHDPSRDRQQELEADLQYLLDAQAEGLLRGLEGAAHDDNLSTGSTTPTIASRGRLSSRAKPTPKSRKPGLRSARKGLYNTMLALSAMKDEELVTIEADVNETDVNLARIEDWEKRREGLHEASQSLNDNEETIRAHRLQEEADKLQADINSLELQLSDMRGRHTRLSRQIAAAENSAKAKLASYESSMKMLEEDVQKFLSIRPPSEHAVRPASADGPNASVWQLPPKRRTLALAKENFGEHLQALVAQRTSVEREREALDEGSAMWRDVVVQVTDFEKRLRADMAGLSSVMPPVHSPWEDPPASSSSSAQEAAAQQSRELLTYLNQVITNLEQKVHSAEEKEWNLLIAAIGAELHALREGRKIIQGVLGVPNEASHEDDVPADLVPVESEPNGEAELETLEKSFQTARRRSVTAPRPTDDPHDVDDDDPDPELMFSRQNIDDE